MSVEEPRTIAEGQQLRGAVARGAEAGLDRSPGWLAVHRGLSRARH